MRKSARLERLTCLAFWLAAAGCQSRAVSDAGPSGRSTSNSEDAAAGGRTFAAVPESKVDLLFDIDNSATMGAKQTYLEQAIPELIARLVTPRCIDEATGQPSGTNADPDDRRVLNRLDCRVRPRPRHAHRRRDVVARAAPR